MFILGDMNIDFLKYNTHSGTEVYLDMLYSNSISPLITKPHKTYCHTATLIDHIYTNTPLQHISAGIATIDISDHLQTFCIANIPVKRERKKLYLSDYHNL